MVFRRFRFAALVWLLVFITGSLFAEVESDDGLKTDIWVVKLDASADPNDIALRVGADYLGVLEHLPEFHQFRFRQPYATFSDGKGFYGVNEQIFENLLRDHPAVAETERIINYQREPRLSARPADPFYPEQWHLENFGGSGLLNRHDIQVLPVWEQGITGRGVTIATVDNGVDIAHPDLAANYRQGFSLNLNDGSSDDARPRRVEDNHGTAVAGISNAARNAIGGVGVAYNASIAAIRLIAAPASSAEESQAMLFRNNEIDIYNNSWGPGRQEEVRFAGPGNLMRQGLATGTEQGRNGKGSLYIWSAGNSAEIGDNSNYDGYANSPYTITVGAVGADGNAASYSEPGANVWVSAPSRGNTGPGIFTTDRRDGGYASGLYGRNFGGTSAAAPIVSGVAALLLEARPELTWRDVRAILAMTSTRAEPDHGDWRLNGAGLSVNHQYGHGMVNAEAALNLARIWPLLPPMQTLSTSSNSINSTLLNNQTRTGSISVVDDLIVETVQVRMNATYSNWGDLEVVLVSPSGTASVLAEPQSTSNAYPSGGTWVFSSVRHFGETASGIWRLQVTKRGGQGLGSLNSWSLEFHGYSSAQRSPVLGSTIFEVIIPVNNEVTIDFNDRLTASNHSEWQLLSVKDPAYGNLVNIGHGQYRYQMNSLPVVEDWIHWVVGHSSGIALDGVLRIMNTQNVPLPDYAVTLMDTAVEIPVLENDFQAGTIPLSLGIFEQPRSGSVTLVEDDLLRYEPNPGFTGIDRFNYQLSSNEGSESPGWVTVIVSEKADWALDFNGRESEVVFQADQAPGFMGSFTLEAWIYPRGWGEFSTGFGRIFDKARLAFFLNGEDHGFYNDESLVLFLEGDSDATNFAVNSPANSIRLNEWQHVAISFNAISSGQARFYINGRPVTTSPALSTTRGSLFNHSEKALYIGEAANGQRAFDGLMAEMRIWDRALPDAEILHYMDRSLSGNETGLVFYLPMSEGSGSVITNNAGPATATGEIRMANWTTRDSPLLEVRRIFSIYQEEPSGWLRDRSLGWIYPDLFPWLYHEQRFGWSQILPSDPGSYWIHSIENNEGWMYWNAEYRPWVLSAETGEWHYQP